MSYKKTLKRLYAISWLGARLGLDRVQRAAGEFGQPQKSLRCVQVAGTNGKGGTAEMISHAAFSAGLRVGLYTSPHMHRFSERIKIDGEEIETATLDRHLSRVLDFVDSRSDLELTFFEVATLTAFLAFREAEVDLAVLEVGLGGRLDATSIAEPEVTVITSVGFDHTELLGNSLEAIAKEKAAIARPGLPMVVGKLAPEALRAIEQTTAEKGAKLHVFGRDFSVSEVLRVSRFCDHQIQNSAVALRAFELIGKNDARLKRSVFIDSLKTFRPPSGRFEVIEGEPRFVFDIAHNFEATLALVDSLTKFSIEPEVMIFGALKDKPVEKMLELLRPLVKKVLLIAPPIARGLDPKEFAGPYDRICADAADALEVARELTGGRGAVLVTGSLFTVSAVRAIVLDEITDPPVGL